MRLLPMIPAAVVMLGCLITVGCQTTPPDYGALTERFDAGEELSPDRIREAFLSADDLPERMERLTDLEAQALAVVEDEPLKLGSIGSAIIDTYVGSLTGHYVLMRFYEYVSNQKAEFHRAWVNRIRAAMERHGDGSTEHPYPVVTPVEGRMYALSEGKSPVGAIYYGNEDEGVPFALLLQVRPEEGAVENVSFDLTGLYESMRAEFDEARPRAPGEDGEAASEDDAHRPPEFTPFTLIGYLAKQNDSAAQTAVGNFLYRRKEYDDAVDWLRAASRTGNLMANTLLASVFLELARGADSDADREAALDQVMENYLHAIALGSTDAMYALGVLYLNGQYGEDNRISGVPLLEQASKAGHSDATLFLAHLNYAGEVVDRNLAAARRLYAAAAETGNPFARKSYARFLLDRDADQSGDPRALDWLEETADADEDDAESLLLLGNLNARGIGTRPSVRRAVRYYREAVERAPQDPNIVNEIAWTLAVSDHERLRREEYARRIMDHLMENNKDARRRPEYLDTWAATYAATGDFARAVTLQQEAVQVAEEDRHDDVIGILREHLEAFSAGETVSEAVP